jgi:hypothetical protein
MTRFIDIHDHKYIMIRVYDYVDREVHPSVYNITLRAWPVPGRPRCYRRPTGREIWDTIRHGESAHDIFMSAVPPIHRAGLDVDSYRAWLDKDQPVVYVYPHDREARRPRLPWFVRFVNYVLDKMDHSDNE